MGGKPEYSADLFLDPPCSSFYPRALKKGEEKRLFLKLQGGGGGGGGDFSGFPEKEKNENQSMAWKERRDSIISRPLKCRTRGGGKKWFGKGFDTFFI